MDDLLKKYGPPRKPVTYIDGPGSQNIDSFLIALVREIDTDLTVVYDSQRHYLVK